MKNSSRFPAKIDRKRTRSRSGRRSSRASASTRRLKSNQLSSRLRNRAWGSSEGGASSFAGNSDVARGSFGTSSASCMTMGGITLLAIPTVGSDDRATRRGCSGSTLRELYTVAGASRTPPRAPGYPRRAKASICGLSAIHVDTERYTPARSEVVQVRRRTTFWLFPALVFGTACASVVSFEPPEPGDSGQGAVGVAGAAGLGGDPGAGGTTGMDGVGGDPSATATGGTTMDISSGGMTSTGGTTSSSTGSTSTGGSQFIMPIGLGGGSSSGSGGRRGGSTGSTGSGSCSLSSCPACNVAQGPACCTTAGKCGCPLFWIPGTCG
jgi:hypothetical protein